MGDLWSAAASWFGWFVVAASVATIAVTYFFLHDQDPKRRFWRNIVLTISAAGVLAGLGQTAATKQLRDTVRGLVTLTNTLGAANIELRARVNSGDRAFAALKANDAKSLADLKDQVIVANRQRQKDTVAIQDSLADAKRDTDQAKQQSQAVERFARGVATRSDAAAAQSRETLAAVESTDEQTRSRVTESLAIARAAAEKAGVYHVPESALKAVSVDMTRVRAGSATVTCASNLVATCADFAGAFERAGWKATQLPGVLPYPMGMLDAVPDPNPATGLIIFYESGRGDLARKLAEDLADCGFAIEARLLPASPLSADVGIAVRFLAH